MSTKSKKDDLTNAKRWCGGEDPSHWSHANPASLELDSTRKFCLMHKVSKICFILMQIMFSCIYFSCSN